MGLGPGKYDDYCTILRHELKAKVALIAIVDGNKGTGFSVQSLDPHTLVILPQVLRQIADDIETDVKKYFVQ